MFVCFCRKWSMVGRLNFGHVWAFPLVRTGICHSNSVGSWWICVEVKEWYAWLFCCEIVLVIIACLLRHWFFLDCIAGIQPDACNSHSSSQPKPNWECSQRYSQEVYSRNCKEGPAREEASVVNYYFTWFYRVIWWVTDKLNLAKNWLLWLIGLFYLQEWLSGFVKQN